MKKLLLLGITGLILGACAFHSKQPIDDTYYKKTQGIAWPDTASSISSSGKSGTNGKVMVHQDQQDLN